MITSLRVLVPGGVGALFFVDLLYRGQTGRKTLYKVLQVVVSALCFVVALGCLYYSDEGIPIWFALHVSRLIYSVFRRRNVKHNALLSFHALVFYLLYLVWDQLQMDTTHLTWWFVWFDGCGAAKDFIEWYFPMSKTTAAKPRSSSIKIALINLSVSILWIVMRIAYFGYYTLLHLESKVFVVLYAMIWLAQLKPAVELVKR